MVSSHHLQMSRNNTSETEEQSLPLASHQATGRKASQVPLRESLIRRTSILGGAQGDQLQLNAIAALGEDRRRASIAIRRQSILQSQQETSQDYVPPYPRGPRESIGAIRPSLPGRRQSTATDRHQGVQERRFSNAERKQSILDDLRGRTAERRGSMADRRRSSVAPVQRSHRRSSVIDVVAQSTSQAVRRASLAMYGQNFLRAITMVLTDYTRMVFQAADQQKSSGKRREVSYNCKVITYDMTDNLCMF